MGGRCGGGVQFPTNVVEEFRQLERSVQSAARRGPGSRKDEANAAKYYAEAGASGKYPKAYKVAIDIYLREKRYDQVEAMLSESHRVAAATRNGPST